uniref:ShKT domain-containing protein n=1 Tax=Caenorhabditis japonica TaxID=281687 RepID=A0A8R1I7Q8_CAEJA
MKYLLVVLLVLSAVSVYAKPLDGDDICMDHGANCRNWALNNFCTNCEWTCEQRRYYCARTCGFCQHNYVCTNCTTTTLKPKANFEIPL